MDLDARLQRCVRFLAAIAVASLLAPASSRAQAFVTAGTKEPIPKEGFKTWSLILVTSQDWLVPENATRLQQLYDRSKAFGRVIGDDHAAVWFWKKRGEVTADNVDVERASAFCKKLGLKPSDGPYLLFTTVYPDEKLPLTAYQAIALGGRSADDIGRLLNELGDQLVEEGVLRNGEFQQKVGSDDFWSAWFDATRHALSNLKSVICFAIRSPSLTIEAGCKAGGGS